MVIKKISVFFFILNLIGVPLAGAQQLAPWNPGGGGGAAAPALKTAPVFDPVIHPQVKVNTSYQFTIGATDIDGDLIKLEAVGPTVQNVVQIINQQGRAEMKVTLKSLVAQQSAVSLVATDATGLITKYAMKIRFVPVVNDLPIVLSAIEHQTIRLGETLRLNVDAYDPDPAVLGMQVTFPNNGPGVLNSLVAGPGYVSGQLVWQPVKAGVFDIIVKVNSAAGAVIGSAVDGVIRVTVKNNAANALPGNTPAVFEPLETKQFLSAANQPQQAVIVKANDSNGDLIKLYATGPSVVGAQQVVNLPGQAVMMVALQSVVAGANYEVISLTAVDQKGNVTMVDLPIDFQPVINNQPTTLMALPKQNAFVGQPFTFDISASDVDLDQLDLKVANVFVNSQFTVNNNVPGFISGTFNWTPQAPGTYRIPVFTNDNVPGKNNAAYGILEVQVQ